MRDALAEASKITRNISLTINSAEEEAAAQFTDSRARWEGEESGNSSDEEGSPTSDQRNESSIPPLPPDPPRDTGAGVFDSEPALAEDYAFKNILWLGAGKFEFLGGKPDAGVHMRHYLRGSGEPLVVSPTKMLDEITGFQDNADRYLLSLQRMVNQQVVEGYEGQPMHFEVQMPWQRFYATTDHSPNWFYAMGGFWYTYTATVDVTPSTVLGDPPSVDMTYQFHVSDYYNWDKGKSVTIPNMQATIPLLNQEYSIGVPALGVYHDQGLIVDHGDFTRVHDTALARLHRAGLAQEYPILGRSAPRQMRFEFDPVTGSITPLAPQKSLGR